MYKTFSYRIKDSGVQHKLHKKACAVNYVWNFCNESQKHALKWGKRWPTNVDLDKLTAGSSKELAVSSTTIQEVTKEYYARRKQFKKPYLRWRSSKKSLDWIPFKANGVSVCGDSGRVCYAGLSFNLWYSRPLEGIICSGSVSEDSRGRYYINFVCKVPDIEGPTNLHSLVGIDLGLKEVVTLSDGTSYAAQRYFRKMERRLATAQKSGKKRLVKKLHSKVRNRRKDFNHKISKDITDKYAVIFIGDVKSSQLAQKQKLAKSVYDAGWYQLKSFLSYKAFAKGGFVREIDERYSTQTCSTCGCISHSSPKGTKGLSIREWACAECGVHHNRDVNAALNILRSGRRSLQLA